MILIVDSGGTKSDWALCAGGTVRKTFSADGLTPVHQSVDELQNVIRTQVLPQVGASGVRKIYFYGSGCMEHNTGQMRQALSEIFFSAATVFVADDLLGAARALFGTDEGVACILGTGSNSCLYDGRGVAAHIPPLGFILGDEGSGAVLGRNFLNSIFKDPQCSALQQAFLSSTGLTLPEIIQKTYRAPLPSRFLASIVPFLHANLENPWVKSLVIENFKSFIRQNVIHYARPDLPIGCVGSLAYHFESQLRRAADELGIMVGAVLKNPLDKLITYHQNDQ